MVEDRLWCDVFVDIVVEVNGRHCVGVELTKLVEPEALGLLYPGGERPQKIARRHKNLIIYITELELSTAVLQLKKLVL